MTQMHIPISSDAVPFVISYRKIYEKPKLVRKRRFVGPVQLVRNALVKVLDLVEDLAFTTETEVVDPGRSATVHWAIQVPDPWDFQPGGETTLVAYRMGGDMPPCGAHFEIISPADSTQPGKTNREPEVSLEESFRARTSGAKFVRPPDPAYTPRPVRPLVSGADDGPVEPDVQYHQEYDDASSLDLDDDADLV